MADAKAESNVREIIDDAKNSHEKLTFENKSYEVIQNHKPSRETKTDFYLVTKGLDDGKERVFKISYKKPSFSFVENKITSERAPYLYGKDWSRVLQEQTGTIRDVFNAQKLIKFNQSKPITLGWRFEMERDKQKGNRKLSTIIQQDIASKVYWGDGCADERKDAKVNGEKVENSGIPEFIIIKDDKDIHGIQDVFDDLQYIREHARNHPKVRASFLAQNWRLKNKENPEDGRKTDGGHRNLGVWVNWKVNKNGKLCGVLVFDNPLVESEGVLKNLKSCLEKMGIPNDQKFRLEMLQGRVSDDTPVRQ